MIIGNGILANSLRQIDEQDVLFFASGVSNSMEIRSSEFEREKKLLEETIKDYPEKKLVYFSTCSVYDSSKTHSKYVLHKLDIEEIIQENCEKYAIFRIGNAVGKGGNEHTLINFLSNSIKNSKEIQIHSKAKRVFIGVDDVALFIEDNLQDINNEIFNLVYPYQFSLNQVVAVLEDHLKHKAICKSVDEGSFYDIKFEESTKNFFADISPEEYLKKLYSTYL